MNKQEDTKSDEQKNSFLSQLTEPIPAPVVLEQYNRIFPDAASRIISMAEKEQEHRHKMQEKLIDTQILDRKRARAERRLGQIFELTVGVVAIVSGSATAIWGDPIAGGVLGSAGVAGFILVLILDRREQCNSQKLQLESSDEQQSF